MDVNQFAQVFPNSTFRIVHATAKNPIDDLVYPLDEALSVIRARGNTYRLGWLVDSEHIVVDIDCKEDVDPERDKAKRVFSAIKDSGARTVLYTTEHGMHAIFRIGEYKAKNVVKVLCGLGVRVDIRVKGGYVIIPFNDSKRKWWGGSSTTSIDEIPFFLKPITKSRAIPEVWGLDEGDGRNDAMYGLLQSLKKSQMSKLTVEEIKTCILLTNKHILKTPMGDRELYSTILRPENLAINQQASSASVCAEYAIRISEENNILYTNGNFFRIIDDTKVYRQITDEDMDRFIYLNYTKELSSKNRDEVIKALKHEVYTEWEDCNRDIYDVPFLNGIYNVKSGGFRPILESDNITYCLPHKYNPDALVSERANAFYKISMEDSPEKRLFFSTMLGYCMTRSAEYQVFFIFKGRGGTGKSTMIDIMTNILGWDNISKLQLADFNKQYGADALFNKLANLGDDISGATLVDSDQFKKASSGDVLHVDRKYKSAIDFKPYAKIIFTTNPNPKIADKSRAMERRMRILSSDRVVRDDERDPNFVRNFTDEDYAVLINDALRAFHRLLASGARVFPDPVESLKMKEKLRLLGDHVYAFIKTNFPTIDPREALHEAGVMTTYKSFLEYSKIRNFMPISSDTFREQIVDTLEYTIEEDFDGIERFLKRSAE